MSETEIKKELDLEALSAVKDNVEVERVALSVSKRFFSKESSGGEGFISITAVPKQGKWKYDELDKVSLILLKKLLLLNVRNAVLSGSISREEFKEEKEKISVVVDAVIKESFKK